VASQYRLTGKLESGELAELFRAERDELSVVVKLFHERTSVKAYAQAIAETTNALREVQHPGISQVIDIGLVKRRLAVVREDSGRYTLGQVLQRLNTKEVVITPGVAIALVVEMLDAVAEAHQVGVLHGAMTPGNVLMSGDGRPSVCDFGALSALNAVTALKKNFAAKGRSAYRAPELSRGDQLSVQSDIYSLGAMVYELLTLREAAGQGAFVSTRREALPPPSRLDRRLNSRIDPVVMRALDPAPVRRYKTASEFALALREFLTANGGLPGTDELKRFVDQLFPRDVQLEPSRDLPFEGAFGLAAVAGADIEALDERSMVVALRASFSSQVKEGEAEPGPDDMTPPAAFEPERDHSTDWHAPAGAMPAAARSGPKESLNAEVLKRVKHIEDFETLGDKVADTMLSPARVDTDEELPKVFPGRKTGPHSASKLATVDPPAASGPASERRRTLERRRRRTTGEHLRAAASAAKTRLGQRFIPIVLGSALAALVFFALGMWRWSSGLSVPIDDPQAGPRGPQPLKHPVPVSNGTKAEPVPPSRPVVDNCYGGPKKGVQTGFLTVSSNEPVAVVVDGDTVCGSSPKILVGVGQRKIVVIDVRTNEEFVSMVHIEPNKLYKLIPMFKGKP
jgi:serine/threonine-protein kinase